jgi:UDP:flavonoid glycosyltransferase YjiC (YdhE family)
MKISMIAFGTRGDVQPAVALGKALKEKGHTVRILAGGNFENWIKSHGLEAIASQIDIQSVMESDLGRDWIEKSGNPIAQMRVIKKLSDLTGWQAMNEAWTACRDADLIFSSFTSDIYAISIAEKTGARHISLAFQPALFPTRCGAATLNAPLPDRKSIINYVFGKLFLQPFNWRLSGKTLNRFRRDVLEVKPQSRGQFIAAKQRLFTVQAYSPHVVPHADDWPTTVRTTGFMFLEEQNGWEPPADLISFLEEAEPAVCIGFGSMVGHNLEKITRIVIDAVRKSGCRVVLLSGWAGIGNDQLGKRLYRLDAAPHEWLYPRVSAAVHHGGAGTTASSLRAGVPTVVVPHLGDQPFWGQRVYSLGVGPKPIARHKLTALDLCDAIESAAADESMKRKAEELGRRIRSEDGIGEAVRVIEDYLG